jgi:hypothetical protein
MRPPDQLTNVQAYFKTVTRYPVVGNGGTLLLRLGICLSRLAPYAMVLAMAPQPSSRRSGPSSFAVEPTPTTLWLA